MKTLQRSGIFFPSQMFSEMFNNNFFDDSFAPKVPAVNIKENKKNYEIEVAAPGLSKNDFKVTVEEGIINICADHEETKENKEKNYTRKEYNYNSFCRSFMLPEDVRDRNIDARYENGILKLTLQKSESTKKISETKEIKVV